MFYISFQQTFPSSTQQVTIPCEHKWNGIRISQRRGWSKSNDKKCRLDLNWLCYPWKSIFYSFMFLKCICFMYKNSNHSTGTICFSFSLLNCLCKWEFHVSATDAIDCDDVGGETRVFNHNSTEQPQIALWSTQRGEISQCPEKAPSRTYECFHSYKSIETKCSTGV